MCHLTTKDLIRDKLSQKADGELNNVDGGVGGKNMAVETVVRVCVWFCIERYAVRQRAEDATECNGKCFGSRPSSPVAAAEIIDSAASVLWQHGVCKWPGCDAGCDNSSIFIRSFHCSLTLTVPWWVGRRTCDQVVNHECP